MGSFSSSQAYTDFRWLKTKKNNDIKFYTPISLNKVVTV